MPESKEILLDGWMKAIRNNPIVTAALLAGTLITVASPTVSLLKYAWSTWSTNVEAPCAALLAQDPISILVPVRNALLEIKALYEKLSSPLYNEPGILADLLQTGRRDRPKQHELMRGMVGTLAQTNIKIVRRLDYYLGSVISDNSKKQESARASFHLPKLGRAA